MTVFLIVLGVVAALVCFVLFIDVNLVLCIKDEPSAYARILFLKFDLMELAEKFSSDKKEEPSPDTPPKKKVKMTPERVIYVIERFIELVKAVTAEICRYVRVKVCHVIIRVATDDAAKTAQLYGTVSGVVWSLLEFLSYHMNVKRCDKNVKVFPDFTSNEFCADIKLVLKIKPIHAIGAMMHLLPILSKRKAGIKNVK